MESLLCVVQVKEGVEDSWVDEEAWRMELYLSVGIMALGLLSLLAVTSLPSVANTVNWREFSFIQVHTNTHTGSDVLVEVPLFLDAGYDGRRLTDSHDT